MRTILLLLWAAAAPAQILSGVISANGGGSSQVAEPAFSQEGGSCAGSCSITITDSDSGLSGFAMQYCTNTGADCTPGTSYTTPVSISVNNTHLCAFANATGKTQSITHCRTFTIAAAPSFVTASSNDNASASSIQSVAQTTGANHLLYVAWSAQVSGPGCTTGVVPNPIDTGSDTFLPLPIGGSGGGVLRAALTANGNNYSAPSCSITGGGGTGATCNASQTGGHVDVLLITALGSGYTGIPTITITDGGAGTGATASVTAMGLSGSIGCMSHWYVKQTAGTTNNQVTVSTGFTMGYQRITVIEAQNTNASAPLDQAFSATSGSSSVSSLTSSSFTTTSANEIIIAAATIEALSNTWVAGSASACASGGGTCTVPSASIPVNPPATTGSTAIAAEYKAVSATQTSATVTLGTNGSTSAQMQLLGATFK